MGGCQCAGNSGSSDGGRTNRPDGGFRRDDAGNLIPPDGSGVPTNPNEQCGDPGQRCCQGGTGGTGECSTGLSCDEENICCAEPGGAECQTTGDCCIPYGCEDGQCVAPEGASCEDDVECRDGFACQDGTCQPGGERGDGSMGSPCVLTEDCNDGLYCAEDATCQPAGPGGDGESCTDTGDCRRGLVCTSEGMCEPAGDNDPGEDCDGVEDCRAGLTCEGGQCETNADCGGRREECCPGGTCTRRGTACTDGRCQPCGEEGEACCEGSAPCGTSTRLVCSRGECLQPRGGCGREDRECCEPDDACVFGLECQDGMCQEEGASDEDDDGGCGDGDSCSSGDICDPFLTNSCLPLDTVLDILKDIDCGQEDELCCPPLLTCEGELRCNFLTCEPKDACKAVSEGCSTTSECCQRFDTLCKPTRSGKRCCRPAGGRCNDSLDCCGGMTCQGADGTGKGRCACVEQGNTCQNDADCCAIRGSDGTRTPGECIDGTCQMAEQRSCKQRQTQCAAESGNGQCCSGLRCGERPNAFDSTVCCVPGEGTCRENEDCCGYMTCERDSEGGGKSCQPRPQGGQCTGSDDQCMDNLNCVFGQCTSTLTCGEEQANCENNSDCCGNIAACEPLTEGGDTKCCGRSTQKDMGAPCTEDGDCCGAMTCSDAGQCVCRGRNESCVGTVDCCQGFVCGPEKRCVTGL